MGSPKLQEAFQAFREQCIWLQTGFNTYSALYESGEDTRRIMTETAPLFFHDLNLIMIEYSRLQVCRLTDPARTSGRDNLTVKYINELLIAENKFTPKISTASDGLAHYRSFIEGSRNKIISHADKCTLLAGHAIGEHTQEDISKFFENLYRYINEVGNEIGVGPLDFRCTSGPGDALDLLRYLKMGLNKRQ